MTADTWTIIRSAIVILIAIAAANHSLRTVLRADLRGLENRMNDVETRLTGRIDAVETKLTNVETKLTNVETKLTKRINSLEADLRGRLGRVEGMLEVISEFHLPPKTAGVRRGAYPAASLARAAMMKSLRCSPPMEWVQKRTFVLPHSVVIAG